jgi:hypothetical protein
MEPSVIQMGKQRTRDRNMLIADLNNNLSKLSISVSFDGGMMFSYKFSCGISAQDTTQHRIFLFDVNIEDECPIGPPQLIISEVGELARSSMKTKGIDLPIDTFNIFVVSPLQQDVMPPTRNIAPSYSDPSMKYTLPVHQ